MTLENEFSQVLKRMYEEEEMSADKVHSEMRGFMLIICLSVLAWLGVPALAFAVGYNIGLNSVQQCVMK